MLPSVPLSGAMLHMTLLQSERRRCSHVQEPGKVLPAGRRCLGWRTLPCQGALLRARDLSPDVARLSATPWAARTGSLCK